MKKQKVLYLITKSSWGGAQRYVFDLVTGIDREKYEPVVALGGNGELYNRLHESGLRVISIKGLGRDVSLLKDLLASFHIAYIFIKERPAVLHVNSSKVGVLGTLLGRLLFLRTVIFTSHGWAFNEKRPAWQKKLLAFLHWLTVFFSHRTIVVSNALKQQPPGPFVQKKMQVVYLGREVGDIKSRDDARGIITTKVQNNAVSLHDYKEDIWLGSIAELHPTKCLDKAIDAVAQLVTHHENLRYVIIHDGQERQRLEQQVKALDLQNHVFFTGNIPEAASLLAAFDVFVLPSRTEAFGYVLVEAGLASVPVVASNVGGIPEVIEDGKSGLLTKPCDSHSLKEALETMLSDSEFREKLATAHKTRSQSFTLEKMIKKTEAVYEH